MRPNILQLESIAPNAQEVLDVEANVFKAKDPYSGDLLAASNPIHGIITRGKGDVSKDLIEQCPDLRVIARCGVGLNNVDIDFATQMGVRVINLPGSNAATVAEHTMALILALQSRVFQLVTAVKAGNWQFRTDYYGDEIR
ncbi:MAG: phosphoglycerate dehydrogenase, partial [Bacteroidota bacterium]